MSIDDEVLDNKINDLYMVFMINDKKYALSSKYIIEIIEVMPITKVPFLPEYMKGIINLRSTIIPVMDARMRFGIEPIDYTERTCIIIIENNINKMGLIVDSVNEFIRIKDNQIMKLTSDKDDIKETFINGISQVNNETQLIVDCDSLVKIVGDMNDEINK